MPSIVTELVESCAAPGMFTAGPKPVPFVAKCIEAVFANVSGSSVLPRSSAATGSAGESCAVFFVETSAHSANRAELKAELNTGVFALMPVAG